MKALKRMFAGLISFVMLFSLISITPAMATDENMDIFEIVRNETNLVANPGLEDAGITETVIVGEGEEAVEKTKVYYNKRFGTDGVEFERSSKESYNGEYSLLSKKRAGGGDFAIPWTTVVRKDATYIASVMVLGTVANKTHWDASAGKNESWGSKFVFSPAANDNLGAAVASGCITSGAAVQNVNTSKLDYTMTAAASTDLDAERASQDDWKRFYTTVQINKDYPEVAAIGAGLNIQFQGSGLTTDEQKYIEVYTDDYYFAELMVADVECTTDTTINVPASGSTTVDLNAVAYNQLGNTDFLEDSEFIWELPVDVDGAYINGNKLIVTDDAKEGNFTVKVTCVPKFSGADTQTEKYTKYRSKNLTFTFVESDEDFFAEIRKTTNKLTKEADRSVERDDLWPAYHYSTTSAQRSNVYEISEEQAYDGSKSLLTKRFGDIAYSGESHFPLGGVVREKAMVASAMVLGTEANAAACEANPDASVRLQMVLYRTSYCNTLPFSDVKEIDGEKVTVTHGESSGNSIKLDTMLDVPASGSGAEIASKDKWQMVHASGVYPGTDEVSAIYYTGAGVVIDALNAEVYSDDYYLGELIVAAVKGTTPKEAYIADEETEIELTAQAYNQLGTTDYFGEDTTYDWEIVALPDGVELVDNKLVISPDAKAGKAVLNVTVNPDFAGADLQTEEQMAGRTNTVIIDIMDELGFSFSQTDSTVTPSAYVVNTTSEDIFASVFSVLYECNGTSKKAVAVSAREISAATGNEEKVSVDFDTFELEEGKEYQISCFMWNVEDNRYEPMISSVSINR